MTARIRIADPLPECALCESPTRRRTYEANGGLCSRCTAGIWTASRSLPPVGTRDER